MISALHKQPDGTIQITVTIPSDTVRKTWDEVVDEAAKEIELPGFRKGKAPRHVVEEKIDKEKVREDVLKRLLPKLYNDAIKEHNLRPIINPKIHINPNLMTTDLSKEWQFTAITCEMPEVKLNNYKQNIQNIKAKATFDVAKSKIIIPGKEPFDSGTHRLVHPSAQGRQEVKFENIIKALLDSVTIAIPQILIDGEVERLLAQTLDDIKKLGLTLDQYLSSTNKTPEGLRDEYKKKAESDIKLEFALQKIAKDEHITVEENEINEAIQKAKDDNERKHLENNRYLLASILRQQKTLDFLKNL